MAINTSRLNIPKPEGHEYFTLENFNNILDSIDSGAGQEIDQSLTDAKDWVKSYGLGNQTGNAITDADLAVESGFYAADNTAINMPEDGAYWSLLVSSSNSTSTSQIAIKRRSDGGEEIYFRTSAGNVWSAWNQLETTEGSKTKADNAETAAIDWAKSFGLETSARISDDLNSAVKSGFYYVSGSAINKPIVSGALYLLVVGYDGGDNYAKQVAFTHDGKTYQRNKTNGVWDEWELQETASGSQSKADIVKDWVQSYGLGTQAKRLDTHIDNAPGGAGFFYLSNGATNGSPANSNGYLIQQVYTTEYKKQLFFSVTGNLTFQRFSDGNGWQPWIQMETTEGSQAKTDALDARTPTRVELTGANVQVDYHRTVIGLVKLDEGNNMWAFGRVTFKRDNGLQAGATADVNFIKKYNTPAPYTTLITETPSLGNIKPCTFTYNGEKWGGIEVFFSNAAYRIVEFYGVTNQNIFAVDYWDEQSGTATNTEINNSLNFDEPVINEQKYAINEKELETTDGAQAKADAVDSNQVNMEVNNFKPATAPGTAFPFGLTVYRTDDDTFPHTWGVVQVSRGSNYIGQIFFSNQNNIHQRIWDVNTNGWKPWNTLETTIGAQTKADEKISRSGDTMDGALGIGDYLSFRNGQYRFYANSYKVNSSAPATILDGNGDPLSVGRSYSVKGFVSGTGTLTGAAATFIGNGSAFEIINNYLEGNSSNHVRFYLDGGVPKVSTWHTSDYNIEVFVEEIGNKARAFGAEHLLTFNNWETKPRFKGNPLETTAGAQARADAVDSNQVNRIPYISGDQPGTSYPIGVTIFDWSNSTTYPIAYGTALNVKDNDNRFVQTIYHNQGDEPPQQRTWYNGAWTPWETIAWESNVITKAGQEDIVVDNTANRKLLGFHSADATSKYEWYMKSDGTLGLYDRVNSEYIFEIDHRDGAYLWDGSGRTSIAGLKSSVSNGKQQVRDAVIGKGGTVADADSDGIPTFQELTDGVNGLISSGISSIQRGTMVLTDTDTAFINPVDLSRSIVLVETYDPETYIDRSYYTAKFNNSSEIYLKRGSTATVYSPAVQWTVIEFNGIKSLQTGETEIPTTDYVEIPINSVNPSKTQVFYSWRTTLQDTDHYSAAGTKFDLSTDGLLKVDNRVDTTSKFIRWWVVESK